MATLAPENVRSETRNTLDHTAIREARQGRSRRFRAILAGGLVLGVGAAVTLAAWNDSEFAQGTFTAGQFNLEGSTDGSAYAEHTDVGAPAALDFSVDPDNLSPGDSVTAAFAVRLDAVTTSPADLVITASPATGSILPNLTYRLDQTTAFGCDLSGSTNLVTAGTAIDAVVAPPTVELADGAGVAGAPAYFCFTVTAGDDLEQTQSGTATWQFAATSTE
jgi:predicted ribosomally synthesized peptide with SipW-like signal peptide